MSSAMYPFLMLPEFHERVWGTRDLRPYFSRPVEGEPVGEVWLTGEDCRVANGPLAGQTLRELASHYGPALIGDAAPQPGRFPLLIKFLFPRQKLSVQVHPDDEGARRVGQACGKTECWYVARAIQGAQVGLGLRSGITPEMFRMAIAASQAEHMLNWLDVHPGDMIYVDAGTVHAIGANSILVETQQNSDLTYRLYDYGRPRPLHLDEGMAAIREKTHAGWVPSQVASPEGGPHMPSVGTCGSEAPGSRQVLLSSPCFAVERYQIGGPDPSPVALAAPPGKSSVQVLVCLEGAAVVESPGSQPVPFMRGDAVVIPAALSEATLRPQWEAEVLRMRLPAMAVAEPLTTLHTSSPHRHTHG